MKYFSYIATIFAVLALGIFFISPDLALAQSTVGGNTPPSTVGNNSNFTLTNPLGIDNFCSLVAKLLNIAMAIGVPIAVFFLVWAGFQFIVARGSDTGLAKAKTNFKYVIIGIAIFLGAWTLAQVISATIKTLDSTNSIQFCGRSS